MKHNIKLPDGTIRTIDCRLGSGVVDKHGKEIFEGDLVNSTPWRIVRGIVDLNNGTFWADSYPLNDINPSDIEVVGHVDD